MRHVAIAILSFFPIVFAIRQCIDMDKLNKMKKKDRQHITDAILILGILMAISVGILL